MRRELAAITAALTLGATSSPPPQTPGSNIEVTNCHAQLDPPPLRIGYTNAAAVAAVEVDFDIVGVVGTIESVVDRGRFEPGKTISHVFKLPLDVSPLGLSSVRCVVTRVLYADGTSWAKPQ
jgi:hypothetical protein